MKEMNNIPEVLSSIRKAFEYVKREVVQNEAVMDCNLDILAADMQKRRQYRLLELDFYAEIEWEDEECEIPVCNIVTVHIPFALTQKGKDEYASLFEMLTDTKPEWLKNHDLKVKWGEPYERENTTDYPVKIILRNTSPEKASRFISFIASYFLPEGNDMEIWTELWQDFDGGGYEPVCDFYPDEGELITKANQ